MKGKRLARKVKCGLIRFAAGPAFAIWLLSATLHGQTGVNTQLSWKTLQDWASSSPINPTGAFISPSESSPTGLFSLPLPLAEKPPVLNRWNSAQLPFFCRIEHNLGKKTNVPFKFRLGSVEYVDWLEGKNP